LAKSAGDDQRGPELRDALVAQHRIALYRLVATEGLDLEVAEDLQAAYEGAVYHVWRANSKPTCYEPALLPDYTTESRSDPASQAQVLAEMAERSAIDEAAVARVEAAIEHDIAFLAMSAGDQEAFVESVRKAAAVGEVYPELADLDMKVPESSLAAARILVQLLAAPSVPTQ
jgi:hypothetical protein